MEIRPRSPGTTPHASPERLDDAQALRRLEPTPAQPNGPAPSPTVGADRLEVSGEARALERQLQTHGPREFELAPARLRAVMARLTSGFYDRLDVQKTVVGRVADELGIDPADR